MSGPQCEDIQTLISGQIDGELSPGEAARLDAHLATCADCRAEYENMTALSAAASNLKVPLPPDEVWDSFLDNVYNRVERKLGWIVFLLGAIALVGYGLYEAAVLPWASLPVKIMVTVAGAGLLLLLVSALRQRVAVLKSDRYSRDVIR